MSILNTFHADIKAILEQARSKARSAVNAAMVEAYWLIGQRIVQEEQQGQPKAQYGKRLMEDLSVALTADFGKGFSYANLYNCRQFYLNFPDRSILYTVCRDLSWSHLRLMTLNAGKMTIPPLALFYAAARVKPSLNTPLSKKINTCLPLNTSVYSRPRRSWLPRLSGKNACLEAKSDG